MSEYYLHDKHNNKYIVHAQESETYFDASIIWNRTIVGRIQCVFDDDNILTLCNLEIFDHPILPRNGLFSLRPFQRPKVNFHQRGLGSAMLKYVIAHAKNSGVVGISGFITPDDERQTPYLLDFYRKHGFIIDISHDESSNRTVTIYREIISK